MWLKLRRKQVGIEMMESIDRHSRPSWSIHMSVRLPATALYVTKALFTDLKIKKKKCSLFFKLDNPYYYY